MQVSWVQVWDSCSTLKHPVTEPEQGDSTVVLFEACALRFRFNSSLMRQFGMALDMEPVANSAGELQIPSLMDANQIH